MKTGNFEEAEHYLTQALELSQTLGDRTREVDVLYALGNLAFTQGDLSAAQRRFERYQSLTASQGLEVRTACRQRPWLADAAARAQPGGGAVVP